MNKFRPMSMKFDGPYPAKFRGTQVRSKVTIKRAAAKAKPARKHDDSRSAGNASVQ